MGFLETKFKQTFGFKVSVSAPPTPPSVILQARDKSFRLVLSGAAVPEQGVKQGSKLRVEKIQYPYSDETSAHVLGVEEEDIVLRGVLHDRLLGKGVAEDTIAQLVTAYRQQKPLVLKAGNIHVSGLLGKLSLEHIRKGYARYELEFIVIENLWNVLPKNLVPTKPATDATILADLKVVTSTLTKLKAAVAVFNVIKGVL